MGGPHIENLVGPRATIERLHTGTTPTSMQLSTRPGVLDAGDTPVEYVLGKACEEALYHGTRVLVRLYYQILYSLVISSFASALETTALRFRFEGRRESTGRSSV